MSKPYDPSDYIISNRCTVPRIIRPGEYLYVFSGSFFVKALVTEVRFVHGYPSFVPKPERPTGIWQPLYLEENKPDDDIQPQNDSQLPTLEGTIIWSIFPWVDWPIGHAAYYGDDSFSSLEEARRRWGRFPKRGKYRRARKHLQSRLDFVQRYKRAKKPVVTSSLDWARIESFYRNIYV